MIDVFHHIPRTGGSTVAELLARACVDYGGVFVRWNDSRENHHYSRWPFLMPVRIVSHMAACICETKNMRHHTFVRTPLNRRISGYLYNQLHGPMKERANTMPFLYFTTQCCWDNEQCRYLMAEQGSSEWIYKGKIGQGNFDALLEKLESWSTVDITEEYENSVSRLFSNIGLPTPNIQPHISDSMEPTKGERDQLMDFDKWDNLLWKHIYEHD